MIESRTAVDVEGAVKQWCVDQGFTTFFGVKNNGTFPQVVLQRISGPDDNVLIQFDVWAAPRRSDGSIPTAGSKKAAADAAASLASALTGLSVYTHDGVRLHTATWTSSRWLPDPTSDRPRYIVEATFLASST